MLDPADLMYATFLLFLAAHLVADYPLQGDYLSKMKNNNFNDFRWNSHIGPPWWLAMASHAGIHAGFVLLITGLEFPELFAAEFTAHFLIDYAKCNGRIKFITDQALHIACKIAYVYYMAAHYGLV